ncbi:hypothetical protein [Treponema pedis]|uniref:hypothetical protein n=1 Tax=Treponema pedis TaxID=409322 RepID=UPI0019802950|nr:hypothetical protein [Treponema pedis]QSI05825.1 hypothetical protein DYQ05_13375 [Treponema pedis]
MAYKKFIHAAAFMLLIAAAAGCKGSVEQPGFISVFSDEGKTAVLKDFIQSGNNEILLTFGGKVTSLTVRAVKENTSEEVACSFEKMEAPEDVSVFQVSPLSEFEIGEKFTVIGSAACGENSILDFSLPFEGANAKPAQLKFSEIRPGTKAKNSYIKFTVTEGGNLFGIYLYSAAEKDKNYAFPAAEVSKGEVIVLHRHLPSIPEAAVDEITSDGECKADEAFSGIRDFWCRIKRFTVQKTNVFLLKTSKTGKIQDAFLCINHKETEWKKAQTEEAAKDAEKAGVWKPDGSAENAVKVENSGYVFIRDLNKDYEKSLEQWSVQKSSKRAAGLKSTRGKKSKK